MRLEKQKIAKIDIYPDPLVADTDPERNISRFATNVRPTVTFEKEQDPRGGGVKVSRPASVYKQLLYKSEAMSAEQRDHKQRAIARLTEEDKKQQFERLINGYFRQTEAEKQQEIFRRTENAAVLTESERARLIGLIKVHDFTVLNNPTAILHIAREADLLKAVHDSLSDDTWSKMILVALRSFYRRTMDIPPDWLNTNSVVKPPDVTGVPDTPNFVKTETGTSEQPPVYVPEKEPEATKTNPVHRMSVGQFITYITETLKSTEMRIDLASGIINKSSRFPKKAFEAYEASGMTQPETVNLETAEEIISETLNQLRRMNEIKQQAWDKYLVKKEQQERIRADDQKKKP